MDTSHTFFKISILVLTRNNRVFGGLGTVLDFICGMKLNFTRMHSPNVSVVPRVLTENNQGHLKLLVVLNCAQLVYGAIGVFRNSKKKIIPSGRGAIVVHRYQTKLHKMYF